MELYLHSSNTPPWHGAQLRKKKYIFRVLTSGAEWKDDDDDDDERHLSALLITYSHT
jgi:hypothetical protein